MHPKTSMNADPVEISEEEYSQPIIQPPIPETQTHTTSNLLRQYAEKIKQQAVHLSEKEKYITLCEQRILEISPQHPIPILQKHIGTKLQNQDDSAQLTELKKALSFKDQDLHFAKMKIEKLNAQLASQSAQSPQLNQLMIEKAQLEKSLRVETLSNEEQRNYIEILKQTLESKIGTEEFRECFKVVQEKSPSFTSGTEPMVLPQINSPNENNQAVSEELTTKMQEIECIKEELKAKCEELDQTKEMLNESEKDKNALLDYAEEMKEKLQQLEILLNAKNDNQEKKYAEENKSLKVEVETLSEKIIELEKQNIKANQMNELNEKLKQLEDLNRQLNSKLGECNSSIKTKEDEANKLKMQCDSITKVHNICESKISQIEKEREELKTKLQLQVSSIEQMKNGLKDEKEKYEKLLKLEVEKQEEKVNTLKSVNEKEKQESLAKLTEVYGKVEQNMSQIKKLQEELSKHQQKDISLTEETEQFRQEIQINEANIAKLKLDIQNKEEELIAIKKQKSETKVQEIEQQQHLEALEKQVKLLKIENTNVSNDAKESTVKINNENSDLKRKLTTLNDKLIEINKQNLTYLSNLQNLQDQLKQKESDNHELKQTISLSTKEQGVNTELVRALENENLSYQSQIKSLNETVDNMIKTHNSCKADWESSLNKMKLKVQDSEENVREVKQMHDKENRSKISELTDLYSKVEESMDQIKKLQYDVTIHQQRNAEVYEELGQTKQELAKQTEEFNCLKRKAETKKDQEDKLMLSQKIEFNKTFQVLKEKENTFEDKLQKQNQELLKQLSQTTQKIEEINKPQTKECEQCKSLFQIIGTVITNLVYFSNKLCGSSEFSLNMKKHLSTHFKEVFYTLKSATTDINSIVSSMTTVQDIVRLLINEIEQYTIVLIQIKVENASLHKKINKYKQSLTNIPYSKKKGDHIEESNRISQLKSIKEGSLVKSKAKEIIKKNFDNMSDLEQMAQLSNYE